MKVIPLAAESLGVRSMAVLVEARGCNVLLDPGVALSPKRNGLEPHEMELSRKRVLWDSVSASARKADVLTISHYHFDHHDPDNPSLFRAKHMLIKHPNDNINKSQKGRARQFLDALENTPKEIEFADGASFSFGNTSIQFSSAVPHGTNTRLGYVVQTSISDGDETFLHTSDVQGPSLDSQLDFILEQEPRIIACDGPMTYMMYRYGKKALERSIHNLCRIIAETPVKALMLDHHLARDLKWREKMKPVFQTGEELGCNVTTFAGYLGREDELLEARRRELWKAENTTKSGD